MSGEQFRRRCRVAIAIVPAIVLALLTRALDRLHDLVFECYMLTEHTLNRLSDWIAGDDMSCTVKPKEQK